MLTFTLCLTKKTISQYRARSVCQRPQIACPNLVTQVFYVPTFGPSRLSRLMRTADF